MEKRGSGMEILDEAGKGDGTCRNEGVMIKK
jgi:hypothetical protein